MSNTVIFFLLSGFALAGALLAVTTRSIFRSAIFLLFALTGVAGIYFWMQYEFIAAVQIIVYVGGIVVLILFSILLTQQAGTPLPRPGLSRILFSAFLALVGFALSMVLIAQHSFHATTDPVKPGYVNEIGRQMLDVDQYGYALPFEVVSLLLLAAMIGCIVIALKQPALPLGGMSRKQAPAYIGETEKNIVLPADLISEGEIKQPEK